MTFKRYTTDKRLWFWISIALFVIQWFVPLVIGKETIYPAYVLVRDLVLHPDGFAMKLSVLAMIAVFYAVRAILLAWQFRLSWSCSDVPEPGSKDMLPNFGSLGGKTHL